MNALNLQVLLLLSAAFFLGAAIACGLRKLFTPAEDDTNVGEFAPAAAVPRPVEPLPEIAAQRAKVASEAANRFEQALAAEQQRAAPAPAPAPRPVPVSPAAVAPVAPKPVPPPPAPAAVKPAAPAPVAPPPAPAPAAAATVAAAAAALAAASQVSAKPAPAAAPAPAPAPAAPAKPVPAVAAPDDLTRIRGIDRDIAARLNSLGVTRFAQIASWMRSDITKVNETFGFRRRVEQENWIEQAQILAAGGQTSFSRNGFRVAPVPPPPVVPESIKPVTAPIAARPASVPSTTPAPASTPAPAAPMASALAATAAAAAAAAIIAPAAAVPPPGAQPVRPSAGPARDQLQRISGINAEIEKLLNVQGVARYGQIASWSAADVERFDRLLGSTGRIQRENWIEQAQFLARGGDTGASREYDRRAAPPAAPPAPAPVQSAPPPAPSPAPVATAPAAPPVTEASAPSATIAAGAAAAAAAAAMRAAAAASSAAAAPPAADAGMRPAKLTDALRDQLPPSSAPRAQDIGALRSVKSEAFQPRPIDAATAAAAAAAAAAGSAKVVRASDIDDLKRIRGIGVLIEKRLNAAGVTTYEQIASWTNNDIARFSHLLDFKGRIERENWVEQARILASGGYTEFSRRVDRGEVETSRLKS